jgi:hypothetical protein
VSLNFDPENEKVNNASCRDPEGQSVNYHCPGNLVPGADTGICIFTFINAPEVSYNVMTKGLNILCLYNRVFF